MDNNTIDTSPVVQAFSDWLSSFKSCFSDFQSSIITLLSVGVIVYFLWFAYREFRAFAKESN